MVSDVVPDVPLVPVEGVDVLPALVPVSAELPLLSLLMPEVPEEEPSVFGLDCVVVVVTVFGALLPDAPVPDGLALLPEVSDGEPGVVCAAPFCAGSFVVVVVVVVCPNVAVAVPISDRKMAKGNFFMLAPTY